MYDIDNIAKFKKNGAAIKPIGDFEMTYASIKKVYGINAHGWDEDMRKYLYKIFAELFSFNLREVDLSSQSDSSDDPTDHNVSGEALTGKGGLPKVKERCKAKVTAWKQDIEVAAHLTKLIKLKDGYKSPVILSLLVIKDVKAIGIKLSFYDTESASENTCFFPINPESHLSKDEQLDIKEVTEYFIQRKPHSIFKFFIFNSEKKLFLRRMKETASDIISIDMWKIVPSELLYLWDFLSIMQSSSRRSPTSQNRTMVNR